MRRRYTLLATDPEIEDAVQDKDESKIEEGESNPDQTFIEKELDASNPEKARPASLTTEILADREAILKEAEEAAEQAKNEEDDDEDGDEDDNEDDNEDDDDGDDDEDDDGDDDDLDDLDFDDPADEDFEEDEEDDEDKDDDKDKDDKDKETKASNDPTILNTPKKEKFRKGWNYCKALREQQKKRILTLQSLGVKVTEKSLDEQSEELEEDSDVVYIKEGIVESLTVLSELNRKYVESTDAVIEKFAKALKTTNEKISNYARVMGAGELKFTNKLISDVDILKRVSLTTTSNPRDTIKRLSKFIKEINDIASIISKTDFDSMKDVFLSKHFVLKGDLIEYAYMIPGFNTVLANIPEFKSFMKTRASDYQYYTNTQDNPTELYDIKGISITDEVDVKFLTEEAAKMILDASVTVDLLKVLNNGFKSYMDNLRILRTEVEDDAFDKLSDIDLDSKIKQFIVFKVSIEMCTVNVKLAVDFISGLREILELSTVFKDSETVVVTGTEE